MQQYRYNTYHNQKRQLVGYHPGVAAPAWKVNQQAKRAAVQAPPGSKILLSRLPIDVGDEEVEALFEKTVGPVKESFIVYNSQGNSKGMAVVAFQRKEDAMVARTKYNGKIIDGRRPIKIEIIKDEDEGKTPAAPAPPSLLQRLAPAPAPAPVTKPTANKALTSAPPVQPQPKKVPAATTRLAAAVNPRIPKRQKKGPRRLKKVALTAAQLDQEMEDYRASA